MRYRLYYFNVAYHTYLNSVGANIVKYAVYLVFRKSAELFIIPYTPVVFCAVSAVIALIAYIPCIVIVFMSACIPAPPLQSEPAIVSIFS